jgi:hypothetical protein
MNNIYGSNRDAYCALKFAIKFAKMVKGGIEPNIMNYTIMSSSTSGRCSKMG